MALLLFLFVLLRALTLGTVLLPFEGWDEYAHLAVAEYVSLHGSMPTPDEPVPDTLWPYLRRHPHPPGSAAHNAGLGAQTYAAWPLRPLAPLTDPRPHTLYQAQHPPLFYYGMAALRRAFNLHEPEAWADAGRIVNGACAAAAVVCWFFIFRTLQPDATGRGLAGAAALVLGANSLFLYNAVRVANDAAAILLASVALLVYCNAVRRDPPGRQRTLWLGIVVAGGLAGAAVLAKTTVIGLVPVLVLGAGITVWRRTGAPGRGLAAAAAVVGGYLLVAGWYHLRVFQTQGVPVPMQEALVNAERGRTIADLMGALAQLRWDRVRDLLVLDALHVGGWSGRPLPAGFTDLYRAVLLLLVGLGLVAIYRPAGRAAVGHALLRAWELVLLVVLVWASLLYHAAQSQLAWGYPTTGAWYGMLALPPLLGLLLLGPAYLGPRVLAAATGALAVVYSAAFYTGTFGEQLLYQTAGLARGFTAAVAEAQVHHTLLHWPVPLSLPAEGAVLLWLLALTVERARGTPT